MFPNDEDVEFVAGHRAPPGRYIRVDAPDARPIVLSDGELLPASCDGTVAIYRRIDRAPVVVVAAASGVSRPRRPVIVA
jgi:hypothetical protein